MKPHYFNQDNADSDDMQLWMAKRQGYVTQQCLLGGATVMGLVMQGEKPCRGCEGPRDICHGHPKDE